MNCTFQIYILYILSWEGGVVKDRIKLAGLICYHLVLETLIVIPFMCHCPCFVFYFFRKKPDSGVSSHVTVPQSSGTPKMQSSVKKKRPPPKAPKQNIVTPVSELESLRMFPVI